MSGRDDPDTPDRDETRFDPNPTESNMRTADPSCDTPIEPTLFPKLQIYLADFPRSHLFIQLEIVHLEDLLR